MTTNMIPSTKISIGGFVRAWEILNRKTLPFNLAWYCWQTETSKQFHSCWNSLVLAFMLPSNCKIAFFYQRLSGKPYASSGEYEMKISSFDVCISFWIFGKIKKDVIVLIRLDILTEIFQYLKIWSLPTESQTKLLQ